MAINYKRCPECGSLKSIKIVYGYPIPETFLKAKEGKVRIGGCCVSPSNPEYFCKDCENEWNKQDSIYHAYNEINILKTSVSSYFSGCLEVEINIKDCIISHRLIPVEDKYFKETVDKSTINTFVEELKMIGILNWKSEYVDPGILDGTQWSIEIVNDKGNIKKYGSNKFPNRWEEFCIAISSITGREFK